MRYFLGVDGGGSKTNSVVVNESLTVVGEGHAGPSNHLRVGIPAATRELEKAIHEAVAAAKITTLDLRYAFFGIAGSDHPLHRKSMIEALRVYFPSNNFTVDSDARIALTAGVGFRPGIVIIAGTGSVAFGRSRSGAEARAGGWGPTIGDEGSGYSIARRGLSAVARAFDSRGPQTAITDLLCSNIHMCTPDDLPYFVYAPTTHAAEIATLCGVVIEAARGGDPVALEILESEGVELGTTVLAVARKLRMTPDEFPVAYVGGAFHAGALLLDPMTRVILAAAPRAQVRPAIESPAMAAARMAMRGAVEARDTRQAPQMR